MRYPKFSSTTPLLREEWSVSKASRNSVNLWAITNFESKKAKLGLLGRKRFYGLKKNGPTSHHVDQEKLQIAF